VATALGGNRAIQIFGCTLAVAVVMTWFYVFFMMIRAVLLKQILWPQKQEDRNEGGWLEGDERLRSEERAKQTMYRRASAIQHSWKEGARQIKRRNTVVERRERTPSQDRADYALKRKSEFAFRGRA
jgi:hypothetical protein